MSRRSRASDALFLSIFVFAVGCAYDFNAFRHRDGGGDSDARADGMVQMHDGDAAIDVPAADTCPNDNCSPCPTGEHRCGSSCLSDTLVGSCGTSCTPCPTPTFVSENSVVWRDW